MKCRSLHLVWMLAGVVCLGQVHMSTRWPG